LNLDDAAKYLEPLKHQGIVEILILSGEVHPRSSRRKQWFQRIYDLCNLALESGFLPHTNVGPLSFNEMEKLKEVNVSMGLMLEQLTPALLQTVHRHAPSKEPQLRLQQLEWAGELQIPFTTGLLLGLGEGKDDRRETLRAIAQIHRRWGHIQEVILQPYSPGSREAWANSGFHSRDLIHLVAEARHLLPEDITLQIPPNLISDAADLVDCLESGARDLGGVGPRDEVNPDYPHPIDRQLETTLAAAGWQLVPRLPVYPQYDRWLNDRLRAGVDHWRKVLFPSSPIYRNSQNG
jgi:FO synthase subunit 1